MKTFMDQDFLLHSETAKRLFASCRDEPIFDFHCHLSPKEICENRHFDDLTALWLEGDHYKWRVMRACGIEEKYVTGDASNYDKFKAWARVMPYCIGNPLYHWAHLELRRYFGIDTPLTPETANAIWEKANEKIVDKSFAPREIIRASHVTALCTTDDPADRLEYHKQLAADPAFNVRVLPSFRPDLAFDPAAPGFRDWLNRLAEVSGIEPDTFRGLKDALTQRIDYFAQTGCVASDHSFAYIPYRAADDGELETIYRKTLEGLPLDIEALEKYQTALLIHLAAEYCKHGIVMELHIGALRNNSRTMLSRLGPNTGFDSVNDQQIAVSLSRFLSRLEAGDILPNCVLYNLNPKDNYILETMAGNFQSSGVNIQYGSAWWFNDHIDGMRRQMRDLADNGVLGTFIGMVTDSRSFLSYSRHEYFRRILCDLLGEYVENGEYPADFDMLTRIAKGISCRNALGYFGVKI